MQFGRSFNLLRRASPDHELVINHGPVLRCDRKNSRRLITPIAPVRTRRRDNGLPRFCPVWPEDSHFSPRCRHAPGSLFAPGAGGIGEIVNMMKASRRAALLLLAAVFVLFG